MPLINCPDCAREVSDRAQACIHCGCPLGPSESQKNQPKFENNDLRKCILVACDLLGRGRMQDIETEEFFSFLRSDVTERKNLHRYVGRVLNYEKVNDALKIHAPVDAEVNEDIALNPISKVQPDILNQKHVSSNTDSGRVTKSYLWALMVLIIVAGYWISKGSPNPALFFSASEAKVQCLRLANKNKGEFIFNNNKITANNTWLKDGKRVVQLLQEDPDGGMKQIMCVYGNGMVQIPSLLGQGRWH